MSRKSSGIWQYCTALDRTHVKCGICKQRLSYKSSITNIKRHLARKHPEVCQYEKSKQYQEYQVAETIEIKTGTAESDGTYEISNENPTDTNDYNFVTTEIAAPTTGTFHIIPKVVADTESDQAECKTEDVSNVYHRRGGKKQKTSNIWAHCTPIDKVYAKCNICEAVLSYKTSITNIKKHLARKHNFQYPVGHLSKYIPKKTVVVYKSEDDEEDEEEVTLSEVQMDASLSPKVEETQVQETPTFLHTYSRKKHPSAIHLKNRVDNKLLDMFIKDYQSPMIVEEIGFRSFAKTLNSSYAIPSRQQILRTLSIAYGKCLAEMKEHAQYIKECCLTIESWTSVCNNGFLTVTAHFIDEEFSMKSILLECISVQPTTSVSKELRRVAEEWGIDQKIVLAVSNNEASVEAAMAELKWNHFGCFAHTLNSLVIDALTIVEPLLEKVRSVVLHFKSNTDANSKLEIYQRNSDSSAKPKKLLQEDGRWISTLRMLERFAELEEPLTETSLLYQDTSLPQIAPDEWKIIHELCQALTPLDTVANFISSEKYTSASLVIVLTKELADALEEMLVSDVTPIVNEVITKLKTGLDQQLGNIEMSETLALCTYLDPRFKNLGFSIAEIADVTKEHLIELLTMKVIEQTPTTSVQMKDESSNQVSFSIWQSFKKRVSECKQPGSTKNRAIVEVERYLEDELMDQQKNPLEWWREYKSIYPCMTVIAQEVMCALGTAIPCDRLFSKNGYALNVRRNCLNSEETKILTFLNGNSELFRMQVSDI